MICALKPSNLPVYAASGRIITTIFPVFLYVLPASFCREQLLQVCCQDDSCCLGSRLQPFPIAPLEEQLLFISSSRRQDGTISLRDIMQTLLSHGINGCLFLQSSAHKGHTLQHIVLKYITFLSNANMYLLWMILENRYKCTRTKIIYNSNT